MNRWRLGLMCAVAGLMLLLSGALALLGPRWLPPALGQEDGEDVPRVEVLMQDIQFLELLRNLELAATQRLEAAKAIEAFHEKRRAIQKMGETDGLLQALTAVREVLVQGQAPTDQMREAVEVARPPDDGSVDRAFREARLQAVEQLTGLLTDEQKTQLQMMPLVEFANHVVGMSLEAREMGDEEFNEWRQTVTAEVLERLRVTGDEEADLVIETVQGTIHRLRLMTPDQIMAQREKLVPEIVSGLNDVLPQNPQAAWDRLADQLWEWAMNPRAAVVLRESAETMGAE
jgi:hypothetical protein